MIDEMMQSTFVQVLQPLLLCLFLALIILFGLGCIAIGLVIKAKQFITGDGKNGSIRKARSSSISKRRP